jgi:hypothetical protein
MILNSESAQLIRENATRLARSIRTKDDLADLTTAGSFEQVFTAIETLLTNTDMFFDDELLMMLDEATWKGFKATLLVYTLNIVNRHIVAARELPSMQYTGGFDVHSADEREFDGASAHP